MLNWKTLLGVLFIYSATSEIVNIFIDYKNGKLDHWPFGVEIGAVLVIALGVFLIKKGLKKKI